LSKLETTTTEFSPTIEQDENAVVGMSYVLREEAQLAQVWSDSDRIEHERSVRENNERLGRVRPLIETLRIQSDLIWERFITLTLERVLSQQLHAFLDEIDTAISGLSQHMVEAECEIDRIRSQVQKRRRVLEEKIAILEPMAHRTSTQTHLNMMLARVEALEAYLLGKKDVAPEIYNFHYKRHTTLPGDLLYMRVRLLTTRVAIEASTRSKQLSELSSELNTLLIEADRSKAELMNLATRLECMSELSRYWLAYLNIAQGEQSYAEKEAE
jgi:cell division septum initiation protein DivIVA